VKLPGREKAYVPPSKMEGYLLSSTHLVGRVKARFFRSIGFDETNLDLLEQHLLAIAHSEEVTEVAVSPHGTKYVIEGAIPTLDGRYVRVRTVWIIDAGQDSPRFVTAYPA
jgi:hypothetical protein